MPQHDRRSALAGAAGRAALFPARAAANAWRDQLEDALDAVLASPETARAVDRALAGPLPEQIAQSIVRHRVLERMLAELAASGELERMAESALQSDSTNQLTDQVLASGAMRRVLGEVVASPEVRRAIAQQTAGLSQDVMAGLRARAAHLDQRADRRRDRVAGTTYAGIVTRALALAADVAIAGAIYFSVLGVATLVSLIVGALRPEWLVALLMSTGWAIVTGAYFVLFWSTAGCSPGMQLLRLRVRTEEGGPPSIARSIVRMVGVIVSIVPLFAGFLPILFDRRRRGIADMLAGTVVEYDWQSAANEAPRTGQFTWSG